MYRDEHFSRILYRPMAAERDIVEFESHFSDGKKLAGFLFRVNGRLVCVRADVPCSTGPNERMRVYLSEPEYVTEATKNEHYRQMDRTTVPAGDMTPAIRKAIRKIIIGQVVGLSCLPRQQLSFC